MGIILVNLLPLQAVRLSRLLDAYFPFNLCYSNLIARAIEPVSKMWDNF